MKKKKVRKRASNSYVNHAFPILSSLLPPFRRPNPIPTPRFFFCHPQPSSTGMTYIKLHELNKREMYCTRVAMAKAHQPGSSQSA